MLLPLVEISGTLHCHIFYMILYNRGIIACVSLSFPYHFSPSPKRESTGDTQQQNTFTPFYSDWQALQGQKNQDLAELGIFLQCCSFPGLACYLLRLHLPFGHLTLAPKVTFFHLPQFVSLVRSFECSLFPLLKLGNKHPSDLPAIHSPLITCIFFFFNKYSLVSG